MVAAAEIIKVHEEEEEEGGHEKVDVKETIPNAESGARLRCAIDHSRMDLEQTCRPQISVRHLVIHDPGKPAGGKDGAVARGPIASGMSTQVNFIVGNYNLADITMIKQTRRWSAVVMRFALRRF